MKSPKEPLWSLTLNEIFNCCLSNLPEDICNYFESDCSDIYLEIGNSNAGLKHIVERHETQFNIQELHELLKVQQEYQENFTRIMENKFIPNSEHIGNTHHNNDSNKEIDSILLEKKYQIISHYIYDIMKKGEYYYFGYKLLPGKKDPNKKTLALLFQLDYNKFLRVSMGTNGFIVTAVPQSINGYVKTSLYH